MRLIAEARDTITKSASTPGSGMLCGSNLGARLPLVAPEGLSPRTVWLAWTGGRGVVIPRGVGARTRVDALGSVARRFGPPRAALSWLVPELLRLGSLTVPKGFAVAGTRARRPTALTRPPGGPVLLE